MNVFTCLRVVFLCMWMVRVRGDILYQALNTSGAVRKKWEGGFWVGQGGGWCIVFRD